MTALLSSTTSMDSLLLTNILCFFGCMLQVFIQTGSCIVRLPFRCWIPTFVSSALSASSSWCLTLSLVHIWLHFTPAMWRNLSSKSPPVQHYAPSQRLVRWLISVRIIPKRSEQLKIRCESRKETVDIVVKKAIWRLALCSTFTTCFSVHFFLLFVISFILLSCHLGTFYWFKFLLQSTFISVFRVLLLLYKLFYKTLKE